MDLEEAIQKALDNLVALGQLDAARAIHAALQTPHGRKAAGLPPRTHGKAKKSRIGLDHPLIPQSARSQAGMADPVSPESLEPFGFNDTLDRAAKLAVDEINKKAAGIGTLIRMASD